MSGRIRRGGGRRLGALIRCGVGREVSCVRLWMMKISCFASSDGALKGEFHWMA